jgi:hypothetical protein
MTLRVVSSVAAHDIEPQVVPFISDSTAVGFMAENPALHAAFSLAGRILVFSSGEDIEAVGWRLLTPFGVLTGRLPQLQARTMLRAKLAYDPIPMAMILYTNNDFADIPVKLIDGLYHGTVPVNQDVEVSVAILFDGLGHRIHQFVYPRFSGGEIVWKKHERGSICVGVKDEDHSELPLAILPGNKAIVHVENHDCLIVRSPNQIDTFVYLFHEPLECDINIEPYLTVC